MIGYHAKGRVHSLQWVYDGTAWDVESGISVTDKHYESKEGAIKHAVKKLVDVLKANGHVSWKLYSFLIKLNENENEQQRLKSIFLD